MTPLRMTLGERLEHLRIEARATSVAIHEARSALLGERVGSAEEDLVAAQVAIGQVIARIGTAIEKAGHELAEKLEQGLTGGAHGLSDNTAAPGQGERGKSAGPASSSETAL